jgi:ABC-type antimicrobial peptide transport system permease subunit
VAQAKLDVIAASLAKQYPDTKKYFGVHATSEQEQLTHTIRAALFVMMVAVGLVLLIACVKVANLLLARATARTREIAIRTALGAGRKRVVRQLLTESLLLGRMAGASGLLLAVGGNAVPRALDGLKASPDDTVRNRDNHSRNWSYEVPKASRGFHNALQMNMLD